MTNVILMYDKNKLIDIEHDGIDNVSNFIYTGFSKSSKMKVTNIGGGFLSIRDELLQLGQVYERCKTNWWTK